MYKYLGNGFWAEYDDKRGVCTITKNKYPHGACLRVVEAQGGLGMFECEVPVSTLIFNKAMAFAVMWGYDHTKPYRRAK